MHLQQWHYVETTASGQPILRENEKDVYVEYPAGCYQGKAKIIGKQKGRIYLTSQRLIYIDDEMPMTNSVSLEIDDIAKVEYSSKFLRKSARLIIYLKDTADDSETGTDNFAAKQSKAQKWTCPICSALNKTTEEISENNMHDFPCENCGVVPDYDMIKDSITLDQVEAVDETSGNSSKNACTVCTYLNYPLLSNCEMCGTRLPENERKLSVRAPQDKRVQIELEAKDGLVPGGPAFVQISFRMSDGVLLFQTVSNLLESQERTKTQNVFNKGVASVNGTDLQLKSLQILDTDSALSKVGITSLEKSQETKLINNDIILNKALSDLSSLMALASDIEKLYNTMGRKTDHNSHPLLTVDREKFLTKDLFIDEISRELYGFIMSEFQEQKEKEGVILITLVDIYALYNKAMRIGSGLVSPQELRVACERFEKLGLNDLHLTRINGRVLCVSSGDSFGFIKQKILDVATTTPGTDLLQLSQQLNDKNGNSWTMGIIMEALNNCVNEGKLLVDEQITGIHYYVNFDWII
ncbi:LAQU0S01e01772g1_1 [Lachancea quebecensis]|uniref:Vacuolar protein-sorting-associated protein 36 n=1 Tax=Lachancea quebecensis TaxID=1654605 RepID=A0A0N7MKR6_9SACH|nr:LAQU0S01e01772g1_1 [Lachancea quebecensis]